MSNIKRGDIFYADLGPVVGSEQGGDRPVLIIQNDIGNKYSPTVIVASITSKITSKSKMPTHCPVAPFKGSGLIVESMVLLEQIRTIDVTRLGNQLGHLCDEDMKRVNEAARISLGLN